MSLLGDIFLAFGAAILAGGLTGAALVMLATATSSANNAMESMLAVLVLSALAAGAAFVWVLV